MNRSLLENVSKSYLSDNNIKDYDWKKIYHYLIEYIENIKYNDPCFYEFMFKLPVLEQVKVLYEIISEDIFKKDDNYISEISISGIFKAISSIFSTMSEKSIKILDKLADTGDKVRDFFSYSLRGEQGRVLNSVIYSRLNKCSMKCGVESDKDLSPLIVSASLGNIGSKKALEQARCLISCYLSFHIINIERLHKQFNDCVSKLSGTKPPDIETSLAPSCEVYRKMYLKYTEDFMNAIEVIFGKDTDEYYKWVDKLNKREVDQAYKDLI
ncbi:MAG: hypothetical protein QXD03_03730 [Candidatus Anstonellales archaeon]